MNRTTIVLDEECLRVLKEQRFLTGKPSSALIRDLIKEHAKRNSIKIQLTEGGKNEKSL